MHVKYRLRPTGCHYIGMAFGSSHLMKKTDLCLLEKIYEAVTWIKFKSMYRVYSYIY